MTKDKLNNLIWDIVIDIKEDKMGIDEGVKKIESLVWNSALKEYKNRYCLCKHYPKRMKPCKTCERIKGLLKK